MREGGARKAALFLVLVLAACRPTSGGSVNAASDGATAAPADGGVPMGGPSDGGPSDGGRLDGGPADGGPSDGGPGGWDASAGDGAIPDAGSADAARQDAGRSGSAQPCTFNADCPSAERCECTEADGCFCFTGARGTGQSGLDRCADGNDCETSLCVEGPGSVMYCSGPCGADAGCTGALPVCASIAFLGRVCIR